MHSLYFILHVHYCDVRILNVGLYVASCIAEYLV